MFLFFTQILIFRLCISTHVIKTGRLFFEYISIYCNAVTDCMSYRRGGGGERKRRGIEGETEGRNRTERVYLQHTKHFLSSKKNAI